LETTKQHSYFNNCFQKTSAKNVDFPMRLIHNIVWRTVDKSCLHYTEADWGNRNIC